MRRATEIVIAVAGAAVMALAVLDVTGAAGAVKREVIPGSELMTHAERERYRERMRGAKTPAEEEKMRTEHLRQVRERARLRGLRIADPDEPGKGAR